MNLSLASITPCFAGLLSLALLTPLTAAPGFTRLTPDITGIHFTNHLSDASAAANQIRLNGSGLALADVNGDGLCDLYLCGLETTNSLFLNQGNWRFTNVTAAAFPNLTPDLRDSTGAAFLDVDADGHPDLLVNAIGRGTRLFLNNGRGVFTEKPDSGLIQRGGSTSFAIADIDGDGDPDLYVVNYRSTTLRTTGLELLNINGRRSIRPEDRDAIEITPEGRVLEHGEPDVLYRNNGNGTFTPISWTDGTFSDESGRPLNKPPFDWGLSAQFHDIDGDGAPDLYVCNDFHSPDRLWINDGKGRFRAAPRPTLRHTPTFSMSVDFADFDRDGRTDFIVADMLSRNPARRLMQLAGSDPYLAVPGQFEDRPQFDRNALQWNRGDGTFADIAPYAGIEATDWTWSIAALDVDLDGFEDLLCTTGHLFDTQDLDAEIRIQQAGPWTRDRVPLKLLHYPRMPQARQAWRNNGNLTFTSTGADWGFNDVGVAHGMAFADLDGDLDLDVVVNDLNGAVAVYRNNSANGRVAVRLQGNPPNSLGIGARLRFSQPGRPTQSAEMIAAGRYLSSDDSLRVFAAHQPGHLEVRWPNGRFSQIPHIPSNSLVIVRESDSLPAPSHSPAIPVPLFTELPPLPARTHIPVLFDDFDLQPLLPRRLSTEGAGVAWADLDADGSPELIAADGGTGALRAWRHSSNGFIPILTGPDPTPRTFQGLLAVHPDPTSPLILGSLSTFHSPTQPLVALVALHPRSLPINHPPFPDGTFLPGPLCAADVDGDGDLDLFVGARAIPGRWPLSAPSLWLKNEKGRWIPDPVWSKPFTNAGLVTGVVAADLDGDGWTDLALATEAGPVRVWRNQHGRSFTENTSELGLHRYRGNWHGITVADFNSDGLPDLAVSNDGLNTGLVSAAEQGSQPLTHGPLILHGDFDDDGRYDILEGRWDPVARRHVPERDLESLMNGLPQLPDRFATYASFNQSSLEDVVGPASNRVTRIQSTWFPSTVFLNRKTHFEPIPLPPIAQFSPAFGITAADFNGDGHADLFLAQNSHASHPRQPRMDAGRGLLLLGNGDGSFTPLDSIASGIALDPEQRGSAAADFNSDGRMDLAVALVHQSPRPFLNLNATPVTRIRLNAAPANPTGIGASIRWIAPSPTPRWTVHAGNSSLSQDHSTLLARQPPNATHLEIVWPGGRTEKRSFPPSQTNLVISPTLP
jgi:hypothetical protein